MRSSIVLACIALLGLTACGKDRSTATADPAARACPSCAACAPSVAVVLPIDFDVPMVGGETTPQTIMSVELDAQGTIVDGVRSPDDADTVAKVKALVAKDPSPRFVVSATSAIPYGRVVHTVDAMKGAGARKIMLGVVGVGSPGAPPPPEAAP